MTTATYEIAGTDELEAFGREDEDFDTSAGIGEDEQVDPGSYEQEDAASGKRKWCLCVVIAVLTVTAVAAVVGVVLSVRRGGNNSAPPIPDQTPVSPGKGPVDGSTAGDESAGSPQSGNSGGPASSPTQVKTYNISVLKKHPHDTGAFTQGFEYSNGFFYESTGLRGSSSLRKVEIDTGKVLQKHQLKDMTLFGEGMTLHGTHHIFMLTWQSGRGLIFNQTTFEIMKEWSYKGEGWGLTMDRQKDEVYMSDGTTNLRVLDPEDLSEKRRVKVTLRGKPVRELNEIEWICGEVWANVWLTSKIFRIDPTSGVVKSIIDASILPLEGDRRPDSDVLNGIAFDKETGRVWLTGKKWTTIYQVSISDESLDLTKCA